MTALQNAAPHTPDSVLHPALPHLDEALERLPERERDVILAHYYQGRTYREIATLREESEAAVQRRASRALEKLSAFLRRRGVAVSAVAVGAGLSGLLRQSAPAELAPLLASSASSAALSSPAPWMGSTAIKAALLVLTAGLPASIAFGVARYQHAGKEITAPRGGSSSGKFLNLAPGELKPLNIEPGGPPGDWRELIAGAAEVLRHADDPGAVPRAAWMLSPLKADEFAPALAWIEALPQDDPARERLAGITLCLRANIDAPAAWRESRNFIPENDDSVSEERGQYCLDIGTTLFLKFWNADPAACIAALPPDNDVRSMLARQAMEKILVSESERNRWMEAVAKTSGDEARLRGAIFALGSASDDARHAAGCLSWAMELPFTGEGHRDNLLKFVFSMAANEEQFGRNLNGWLDRLPADSAGLPDLQRAVLGMEEEIRMKLSGIIRRPDLLKSIQDSL
jgi:hypothetical protein